MIGERIRQLRTDLGIGPDLLAKAAGISRNTLNEIEAGVTLRPLAATVKALADALGVTPADLAAGNQPRLIDEGWWPPNRVRHVVEAVRAMTAPSDFGMDESIGAAVEMTRRLSRLRAAAGLEPHDDFPVRLDTSELVAERMANPPVRDRSVADGVMHC